MDTGNRLTHLRGDECEGTGRDQPKTYMHICIAHGHRQQCGEGLGGGGGWVEEGKWWTSVIVSTIRKEKIIIEYIIKL